MTRFSFRDPPVWLLACTLMAVLLPAFLLNNYHYFFRYELYEFEDLAADSLQILKAKSFHEGYGQYSRWGFHHPGPAFFYVQAWGEILFYDWWHLVPRPLNAQMLATLLFNVALISGALATATRWIGIRTVFLPLALAFGVLQYANISFYGPEFGAQMLFGNWPAVILVVPFATMLVALASVAAGRGESLPFAMLVVCFLAHGHIAQATLFVLPLSASAYVGLWLACGKVTAPAAQGKDAGVVWKFLTRPWRTFPRAHWTALVILAVFLLPILLDLCLGRASNFAQILAFRREHVGEPHKTLTRSLLYFLQYGAGEWYHRKDSGFAGYTTHGLWEYLSSRRIACEFWVLGTLGTLTVMASWLRRRSGTVEEATDLDITQRSARRRYTVCLAILTSLAIAITLGWGCLMSGEMYYFNAYFNFGIFYVGTLVMAGAAADLVCVAASPQWSGRGMRGFLYVAVGVLAALNASSFRLVNYAHDPALAATAANVDAILRAEPATEPRARFLEFYPRDNALAVDVALLLERAGHPYLVPQGWEIIMGKDHSPAELVQPDRLANGDLPFRCWRLVPFSDVPAEITAKPLFKNYGVLTEFGTIDPSAGAEIRFGGPTGNDMAYTALGWAEPERDGTAYRWSGARQSLLEFHAKPVPAGSSVHVIFDGIPFLLPGKRLQQRVGMNLNGTELGEQQRNSWAPFEVIIPAAVWNAREDAWLLLRFPDAATPGSLGMNTDSRTVAFAFRHIGFRVEPGAASASP